MNCVRWCHTTKKLFPNMWIRLLEKKIYLINYVEDGIQTDDREIEVEQQSQKVGIQFPLADKSKMLDTH